MVKKSSHKSQNKNAFTLVEILAAVLLLGFSIVALLLTSTSFTQANSEANNITTAEFLLEQIKEMTVMNDFDQLHDLDDTAYCPPVTATQEVLAEFPDFSQNIIVQNVNSADFSQVVADYASDFIKITVTVSLNSKELCSASWIRTAY